MSAYGVHSEIGRLRKVIVHRPDARLENIAPNNPSQNISALWAKRACKEHDMFVQALREKGVEILYLDHLLEHVLKLADARDWLLDRRVSPHHLGPELARDVRLWLDDVPAKELALILTGGVTKAQLPFKTSGSIADIMEADDHILPPLPNQMFTQDTSSWIYEGMTLNPIGSPARRGEGDNIAAVYHFHPKFEGAPVKIWWGLEKKLPNYAALQGGDILVLGQSKIAIAMGTRTTAKAVTELTEILIHSGSVEEVIIIKLPRQFETYHLDMFFSLCGPDLAIVCKPVADSVTCYSAHRAPRSGKLKIEKKRAHLVEIMRRALGIKKLRTINTEITDGAGHDGHCSHGGVLVVEPEIVISYESDITTNQQLTDAGIETIPIETCELSRSGGAPRRLVCTARRDPFVD